MSSVNVASRLWRSLEELTSDPEFLAHVAGEFPHLAASLAEPMDRRQALRLMGAALMIGAVGACESKFGGNLIPAVKIPPNIIPALPNFYATAHVLEGYASGVVVKHNMGRPVGVEGNPHHPASLGAIDALAQAQLLDFYDPDRAAALSEAGRPTSRARLEAALSAARTQIAKNAGAGLRILTGTVTSPTLLRQMNDVLEHYPQARWIQWNPLSRDAVHQGAQLAYGRPIESLAYLDRTDLLVAIDGDLLDRSPGALRHARDLASRRNPTRTNAMSRIYAIEPTPTLLGAIADHRFIVSQAALAPIVARMAREILREPPMASTSASEMPPWLGPLIEDLRSARGRVLIHAGASQSPEVHALVHAMNEALGARGVTFDLIDSPAAAGAGQTLGELIKDMQAGRVENLLIVDSNPAYAAPGAWGFADALKRVRFSLALTRHLDETARLTNWFVPKAHEWESWSDARAFDGSATILQPQSLPLYGGLSTHELLALYRGASSVRTEDAVRGTWTIQFSGDFETRWREALASGVVSGTASAKSHATLRDLTTELATPPFAPSPADASMAHSAYAARGLEVLFRLDPSLWDGRYANNPWLQELPRPLTKLVWDNPLLIAPALAKMLDLANGDLARLTIEHRSLVAPVWIHPGQARDCITAHVGSGRWAAGSIGDAQGVDFYPLTGLSATATLEKVPGHVELASTVHHNLLFETPAEILRHGTLAEFGDRPHFATSEKREPHLYQTTPPGPAAWAMSIDLNACIGCNACIIACQAENNVAVVGKKEVLREREMHWLRIDRYFEGSADAPQSFFQPVLCMHCEEAPCENVCPVGATVHDSEGLNVMVYNRCVGTRFCSNNCPYKVRRFNFFGYARQQHRPPESWNADVTVRARGVMEKCSYCLQRIAAARIAADRDSRPVGEVKTACQSACPTQAFTFGNLAEPDGAVVRRKQSPLSFAMLEQQNTKPRTTYEALIRNPNPKLSANAHEDGT